MKKIFVVVIAAALMFSFASSELSAKGIIIKGGYAMMQNDLSDAQLVDQWNFGLFFDMGPFLFNSLVFRPGVDWVSYETENVAIADVYGIHFDWYWYFMGNSAIAPFLGFGPSLNYYDYDSRRDDNEDSDAGVDVFAGASIGISGTPLELILEARYRFMDIAARSENILAFNLGIMYKF